MNQHDQEMVAVLDDLINNQRAFKEAQTMFVQYLIDNSTIAHSAHLYFRGFLLETVLDGTPEKYMTLVRESEDYTKTMEGDMLRDTALALIRKGKFDQAKVEVLFDEVARLHGRDDNRMAALAMTQARMHYALRQYGPASSLHLYAESIWQVMLDEQRWGEVDEQWRLNNAYHAIRAIMMLNRHYQRWLGKLLGQSQYPYRYGEDLLHFIDYFMLREPAKSPRLSDVAMIKMFGFPGLMHVMEQERARR